MLAGRDHVDDRGLTLRPAALLTIVLLALLAGATHARADQSSPIDPEIDALTRAMNALQRGRLALALEAIEAPSSAGDVLTDYRAWIRARILYALGKHEEAREALSIIPPCVAPCKHPLAIDVAELTAHTYERKAPLKAARMFSSMATDGRLYARGVELFRSKKQAAEADALEERLLVDAAHSPEAHRHAAAIGTEAMAKRISIERRRTRILTLLGAHDNEEARREADALIAELPKKHPLLCELHDAAGRASRKLHDYKNAVISLSRARKECARLAAETEPPRAVETSSTTWATAQGSARERLLKGALLETEVRAIRHDVAGARATAQWIESADPARTVTDDAWFLVAELLEREVSEGDGIAIYQKIVERGVHPLKAEAAWRIAFAAIDRGDVDRARALLATIDLPNIDGARARYWTARLSESSPTACDRYREVVKKPALTFYAWLALDRVERALPDCARTLRQEMLELRGVSSVSSTAAPALAFENTNRYARAQKLVQIPGFKVYGSLEIGQLRGDAGDRKNLIDLALAFDAIGDHRRAQLALRSKSVSATLAEFPSGDLWDIWRTAYSRPFEEEVERAASAEKIDPWLLYALAREESTFDPEVISWAGAIGLAQLMPATARAALARLHLGRLRPTTLIDPGVNLRLGAHVLNDGLKRFKRSVPLALMAYNGGPGAVVKNLPATAQDFDKWVETIPVAETRKYVKRVIQTFGIYHFLYDEQQPFIDLPDRVLR